ncbi:MAG: zf-HC2 domain-containing protein [Anaerolineae bacterium]
MTARSAEHLSAEWLSAYLDGQVTPAERQVIEAHLRTCPECAWEFRTLRHTVSLLHQVPQVAVPRPLTLREIEVQPARPRQPWVLPYLQGATALATLLLVVLVAGDLFLGLGGMSRPTIPVPPPAPLVAETAPQAVAEKAADEERLALQPTEETLVAEVPKGEAEMSGAAEALGSQQPEETPSPGVATEAVASPAAVEKALPSVVQAVASPEATPSQEPVMRMAAGEEVVTATEEVAVAAALETALPEATVSPEFPAPEATPLVAGGVGGGATEEPTPMLSVAATEVALAAPAPAAETPTPAPTALPTLAAMRAEPLPSPTAQVEATRVVRVFSQPAPWQFWVRLGEFALLGAVLALGGLTLLLSRRR